MGEGRLFGLGLEDLFVLSNDHLDEVVLGLGRGSPGRELGGLFAIMPEALAEILVGQGVDEDGLLVSEGIEANEDLVAPELWIDFEEEGMDLDIGEVPMNGAAEHFHEEGDDTVAIHATDGLEALMVAVFGGLFGLRVDLGVVADVQPSSKSLVDLVQGQGVSCADLGLELGLESEDEPLDQAARGGITHRAMEDLSVDLITGGLEFLGDEDFGVVEVDLIG
jgi:hypothetical protein